MCSSDLIGGDFTCSYNKLTSLKGGPQEVGGNFVCYKNPIESLDGIPLIIGYYFSWGSNADIKWNINGWLEGLKIDPNLFGPLILNRSSDMDPKYLTPEVMAALRKNSPDSFDGVFRRLGDGASTLADLGELGF